MSTQPSADRDILRLSSELLDLAEPQAGQNTELSRGQQDELADLLVVDALLRESAVRDRGELAARRERILAGVHQSIGFVRLGRSLGPPRRAKRPWLAGGVAAAAALAFFLMLLVPSPASRAYAALARSLAAAREPIDRQYSLRIELVPRLLGERVIVGDVSVRGQARFVAHVRANDAPDAIGLSMGFDGRELWTSPPARLLRGLTLRRLMVLDEAGAEPPHELLDIGRALERLHMFDYSVELLPEEPLLERGDQLATRLLAIYHGSAPLRPRRVEIWSDPQTGVIWKLIESWPDDSVAPLRRVELLFQGATPQDDSIYERPGEE